MFVFDLMLSDLNLMHLFDFGGILGLGIVVNLGENWNSCRSSPHTFHQIFLALTVLTIKY